MLCLIRFLFKSNLLNTKDIIKTLFVIFILFTCEKGEDKFIGYWYIDRDDIEYNKIYMTKANDNYIIDVNNTKLIGQKDKNILMIENKGKINQNHINRFWRANN